ncbi:hypothetical protein J1614_007612 [Plenodomus biglobosus]|nr:hypothetical protein J1614_007612 [Plenodomus biglobosus]
MKGSRTSAAALVLLNSGIAIGQVTCPSSASFSDISAGAFFANMDPGWNVGNTLDAVQTEGDWNNPPVVAETFDDVKNAGFKSVRIPVTWAYHSTTTSPTWTLDPTWLQRVSDVIDMALARDFYIIVNIHHDSWTWADLTSSSTNVTQVEERLGALWYQIGTKLACVSEKVAFETINEIPGTTAEHGAVINRLNGIMLEQVNRAGGFNGRRVVNLVGAGEDGYKTIDWFERPDARWRNPWGIQYHYYSPYDFVFAAWGKTTWGSAADKATLEADIAAVRGNFTDVPLVIGEWAVSPVATETSARWRYFDFFVRTAAKYNTTTVLWDNGADFLNRATHVWRDAVALDIYRNAVNGVPNALPDSTTDGSTSQASSAYLYHRANETVADTTLPFLFNGNTLSSIALGTRQLARDNDYRVSGESITFAASFLQTVLTPSAPMGSLANLTLTFNRGAALSVNILKYDTPTIGVSSIALPASSADYRIPVQWAGQNRPATVKALRSDGTYLVDDWTQFLPPLQQARLTYANHFDWDADSVILKAAVFDAVRTGGRTTVFTIEFYPREPGNSVEFTVTV